MADARPRLNRFRAGASVPGPRGAFPGADGRAI
jgi:hypothetical protein